MAEEEKLTWYEKLSDAISKAVENVRDTIDETWDRVAGKESSFEINLEDVGVSVGERKYTATGSIKIKISTLK